MDAKLIFMSSSQSSPNRTRKNDTAAEQDLSQPPMVVRYAGIYGIIQGVVGVIYGLVLVIREAGGVHDPGISGYATAAWFLILFGAIVVCGIFLYRGRAWGRGPIVMLQICLMPVAYYMFTSGRPELAVPTILILVLGLVLLFNPTAVNWWTMNHYGR